MPAPTPPPTIFGHRSSAADPGRAPLRHPILVFADAAGCSKAWLAHLRRLRVEQGLDLRFSVGFTMTPAVQDVILALPARGWIPAIEADGSVRDGADVAELTGCLGDLTATGWPADMRVIVRRERLLRARN